MINPFFKNSLLLLITFKLEHKFKAGVFCLSFSKKENEVQIK